MANTSMSHSEVKSVCASLEKSVNPSATSSEIGKIKAKPSGKSSSGSEKESEFHGHGRGPSHTGGKK